MSIENFSEISKKEQVDFINSFDRVIFDLDGVLWVTYKAINGAPDCVKNLKLLGKDLHYVTNNAVTKREDIFQKLLLNKFDVEIENVLNPCIAVIDHLKKINFQKKIFVLGTQHYKDDLIKEGFIVAENPPAQIEETIVAVLQNIQDDQEIGAVIIDNDLNLTWIKLSKALTYLKRKDCLFFIGASDKSVPIGPMGPLMGCYYLLQGIIETSGRMPIQLAKPSQQYSEFIIETLDIKNPERVLFVGDAILEDMHFATISGFRKLLVLTGNTKEKDIINWKTKHPEEDKPDYYIESIADFNRVLIDIFNL